MQNLDLGLFDRALDPAELRLGIVFEQYRRSGVDEAAQVRPAGLDDLDGKQVVTHVPGDTQMVSGWKKIAREEQFGAG